MLKPIFLALLASSLTAAAQSPSFDCAKAATPTEKTICAYPDLAKADAEMTAAYRALLAAAPAGWQPEIRESQRVWLRDRQTRCLTLDKTIASSSCILNAENDRIATLRNMVQHHNSISFIWRSIYLTAQDDADTIKIMKEQSGRDSGYVNASWPQAISSAPEWIAWNKVIAEAAGPGNAEGETKPRTQWTTTDAVNQDTDVTVSLNSVSGSLVSASVFVMTYSHGAAHPNHGTGQLNWMLKEQRRLKGSDLFQPQMDWNGELYNRVNEYLHKTLDADDGGNYENWLSDPKGMQKIVHGIATDPSQWQIDEKGITIVFNPYEVACYACTPEPFTMSWQSLKPLLNPSFQIPAK
jgi:uncharacterized protein